RRLLGGKGVVRGQRHRSAKGELMKAIAIAAVVLVVAGAAPCAAQQVTPYLECVDFQPGNTLEARFGYVSTYPTEVTINIGPEHFLSPGTLNRGQPTVFLPGDHHDVFRTTFHLSGSSTQITWFMTAGVAIARWATAQACSVTPRGDVDAATAYNIGDLVRE